MGENIGFSVIYCGALVQQLRFKGTKLWAENQRSCNAIGLGHKDPMIHASKTYPNVRSGRSSLTRKSF